MVLLLWVVEHCIADIADVRIPTFQYLTHIPANKIVLSHFQLFYICQGDLYCRRAAGEQLLSYFWELLAVFWQWGSQFGMKVLRSPGAEFAGSGIPPSSVLVTGTSCSLASLVFLILLLRLIDCIFSVGGRLDTASALP